jgi:hypothetical protein
LLAAALVVGLAGCGADEETPTTGPDQEQLVRTAVAKFGIATQKKDYQQICDDLLSRTLVQKIETVGLPCEGALQRGLGDVKAPTLEITAVSITNDKALVSVHTTAEGQEASNDALQLVRENGAWKIDSLAGASGGTATSTTTTPTTTTKTTKKKSGG